MQKARLIAPINVNEHEVTVAEGTEALVLAEHPTTTLMAMLAGVGNEAVLALPNDSVDAAGRAILTSEPVVSDITNLFDIDELKAKLPEGYFMVFAIDFEYELIG